MNALRIRIELLEPDLAEDFDGREFTQPQQRLPVVNFGALPTAGFLQFPPPTPAKQCVEQEPPGLPLDQAGTKLRED